MGNTLPDSDAGQEFSYRIEKDSGRTVLFLSGIINERAELDRIFSEIPDKEIFINLKGVTRINSGGVRDWINATKPLAEKHLVCFIECSQFIINQLNMIMNFLNSGEIVSFYAPYYCATCDQEHEILLELAEHFKTREDFEMPEAPEMQCPGCNKNMELNQNEEKYFYFMKKLFKK